MPKIRNTGITDKWDFCHTYYIAIAIQNLKESHNSSLWTCSHIMDLSRSENKMLAFWMIFAWLCGFNSGRFIPALVLKGLAYNSKLWCPEWILIYHILFISDSRTVWLTTNGVLVVFRWYCTNPHWLMGWTGSFDIAGNSPGVFTLRIKNFRTTSVWMIKRMK